MRDPTEEYYLSRVDLSGDEYPMKLFEPLYSAEGGPPLGWYCFICTSVFRTRVGMEKHLWRLHGMKEQQEMDYAATEDSEEVRSVREGSGK